MLRNNFTRRINFSIDIPPPPPPPTSPKSRKKLFAILAAILIVIIIVPTALMFSGALNFTPPTNPTPTPAPTQSPTNSPIITPGATNPPTTTNSVVSVTSGSKVPVTSQVIGSGGGTIQVSDTSSPLYGLKIVVPAAATSETIQFSISYADVSGVNGLPTGASAASKLVTIDASGSSAFNNYDMFDKPVEVTLPYDSSAANSDSAPVRFYWYDSQNGQLDATGFLRQDKTAHTITFLTASFSDFIAVEVDMMLSELSGETSYSVDTGFRPLNNGWFIPNYGSVQTPGGMCLGMVNYAKWYYTYHSSDTGLHSKYIEGDAAEWRDDATAIQLAARAHLATSGIWSSLTTEEYNWAVSNAREVGLSWLSGMIVTGEPQLIGLKARDNSGTWLNYAHAVLTYGYQDGAFQIYDPNFPGSSPSDSMREIPFDYTDGFSETYISGRTRSDNLVFNIFYHAGSKLSSTPSDYQGLYDSAQSKFQGSSTFPTVTLTDITTTPAGTTPIDTDGDGVRDTSEATTVISGTITGGTKAITSTLIFVDNKKYTAEVVNGEFSKEVPLLAGDNDVVILATDENTFSNWAGFLRDIIKCTASPASFTVTLTWDQGESDVDLHVLEPGTDGRHIYYGNKGTAGGENPYLDIDNRAGYGPEHYYAIEGTQIPSQTNLYGTYQVKVQYYDDKSGAETPQTITYHLHVKYLAFKNDQTGQEFWIEQSRDGVLSTDSSVNTDTFSTTGASWSTVWSIDYSAPNPADYGIPPPPQNQFPT
ncbi:MAG: hypothetical protein M1540_00630 [Candidatus Bathyarchaeota archaeon]|nr:hypothetical protein [Candidatus Bathyarchaeota archaeon]